MKGMSYFLRVAAAAPPCLSKLYETHRCIHAWQNIHGQALGCKLSRQWLKKILSIVAQTGTDFLS